ncbi:unnamed protein product [Polarella glacialis]|uniref:Methyltransferase domain-containing protein n=1 Tax=Polarella glacialis TaxID=89957 RepID=A0A813JAT2_POLGL|nr:unnamed protein product [Polarella glacialis]
MKSPSRMAPHMVLLLSTFAALCVADDGSKGLAKHVVRKVPEGDIEAALRSFIAYSERKGLGMHLGKEKGDLIELSVRQGLPDSGPAVVFEAGCHAGDGTLSAIAALRDRPGSTIVSTETNKEWLDAAKEVVEHVIGNLDINYMPVQLKSYNHFEKVLDALRAASGITSFDAVIFDHDETLFLAHLKVLLSKGFLRKGSTVEIDNVKRKAKQLKSYMEFVSTASGNGFRTEVKEVSSPYPDAVAISTYLGSDSEL